MVLGGVSVKKNILLLIGLFLCLPGVVNATSSAPNGIQTTTSTTSFKPGITGLPLKIYNDSYPNWDVSQFLEIYSYEEYPYIVVEFCSYNDVDYYVSSSYSSSNFYNYGGLIQSTSSIGKCHITGVDGEFNKKRAVIQVSSWGDPHGGSEALSTRGTIKFRNRGEYSQYIEIQNVYLTDSNQFQPNLDDTNSKLDEAQETRKGIWESIKGIGSSILNLPSLIWNAIKGGFEAITDAITGLFDFFKDDSVDNEESNSFFGDFSDTDHGGISGVITAPLTFIRRMTDTCSPLQITMFDKQIDIPCGDTLFWNKPEVSSFRTTWNVIVGGPILYLLLCWLFKVIEGLKNPDDSRIEVMKL